MAERPEDLNLPNAVVTRIIKEALPDGVNVSKEARLAISKAASVFVLYATSCSNNFALKNKRKTINAQDVMSAMEDMEFEQFIEPLQQCQEAFVLERKEKKKDKPAKQAVPQEATIEEEKLDENNEIEKEDDKEVEEISDEDAENEKEASVNDVSADVSSSAVEEKSPDEEVNEESEEVE